MSEYINNHTERQQTLKALIRQLHAGATVEDVKTEFATLLQTVGASEVAEMEQALISEGIPETEVKRLCDVHVAVFRESLDAQPAPESLPGHPVHTFRAENVTVEEVLDELGAAVEALQAAPGMAAISHVQEGLRKLRQYEAHYVRKENILFPYLEQHGFSGPSAVMWAIHDDIRAGWKALDELFSVRPTDPAAFIRQLQETLAPVDTAIREMCYKEENILFPTSLEKLSDEEWAAIRDQEADLGYAYVQPGNEWPPAELAARVKGARIPASSYTHEAVVQAGPEALAGRPIPLEVGALTTEQINLLLTNLPVDVTFVDENDEVRFFSETRERIFPRSPAIIGRKVQLCHPPASVHRVQQILLDFREGTRDEAEFWIQTEGLFVHIRYFALRDKAGAYRGTLEVTQELSHVRALEGERRLLDD
jgi:DUF438 domain-containing protein